jgi:hypothetical protein
MPKQAIIARLDRDSGPYECPSDLSHHYRNITNLALHASTNQMTVTREVSALAMMNEVRQVYGLEIKRDLGNSFIDSIIGNHRGAGGVTPKGARKKLTV